MFLKMYMIFNLVYSAEDIICEYVLVKENIQKQAPIILFFYCLVLLNSVLY